MAHHSQQDGDGRLGKYLVLFDPESEKCILLTRNQLSEREVIERSLRYKNHSSLGYGVKKRGAF
jgi:hypothetical protein